LTLESFTGLIYNRGVVPPISIGGHSLVLLISRLHPDTYCNLIRCPMSPPACRRYQSDW